MIKISTRKEVLNFLKNNPDSTSKEILLDIKKRNNNITLNSIQVYLNQFLNEEKIRKSGKREKFTTYCLTESDLELLAFLNDLMINKMNPKPGKKLNKNEENKIIEIMRRIEKL